MSIRKLLLFALLLVSSSLPAQKGTDLPAFKTAFQRFLKDPAFRHALIGLKVFDLKTGKVAFDYNGAVGFQAASTQKVITAATSYALLGDSFRFRTQISYEGLIDHHTLNGNLIIKGSGDPTLGSFRFSGTKEQSLIKKIVSALTHLGIDRLNGAIVLDETVFNGEAIPSGWVWEDLGSYYGAPARGFDWRENQYDLYLNSGNSVGSTVRVAGTDPGFIPGLYLNPMLKAAGRGTGDQSYIYYPGVGDSLTIRGTIPLGSQKFRVSGSIPNPGKLFAYELWTAINQRNPGGEEEFYKATFAHKDSSSIHPVIELVSPPLDSISYWFLNRSINLYGEALLKTLGNQIVKDGNTVSGLSVIKRFWNQRGIDSFSLGMVDGSGLSPANRITPDALVDVLLFARRQAWFKSYYKGFPVIHGIRMKSGTITGTVAYAGFIQGTKGDFAFSIIVNNPTTKTPQTRSKIWNLLDHLK